MLLRYLTSSTSWLMKTSLKPPCLPNNAQKQCKQIFESAMDKLVIRILFFFFSFLQERERQAMNTAKRKAWSNFHQPPDDDDDDPSKGPPGSCGGGPGFTTPFNRFVF